MQSSLCEQLLEIGFHDKNSPSRNSFYPLPWPILCSLQSDTYARVELVVSLLGRGYFLLPLKISLYYFS
ncbi:hypothetical protein AYI69_g1910 [Smittium culicis]|uniref:Uncharacterized protein n=1 Tax=Smittium culicis TaxID=133412 RepID=A0A1R1YP39_9FUNG|nr:hypothetical protein AYI69_g1910 [Smittium culicis]